MASSARIDELRKKFDENPRRYFAPLANEYRKAGDPEQAIFICQEYLPQQPGHMSGHIVYGQALYELNRHDEAKVVFETALSLDPENLIALRHLGDIARTAGDAQAARAWYERVLEADPRNEEIGQIMLTLIAPEEMSAALTPVLSMPAIDADARNPVADMAAELARETSAESQPDPFAPPGKKAASEAPAPADEPPPPPPVAVDKPFVRRHTEDLLDLDDFAIPSAAPSDVSQPRVDHSTPPEPSSSEPGAEPVWDPAESGAAAEIADGATADVAFEAGLGAAMAPSEYIEQSNISEQEIEKTKDPMEETGELAPPAPFELDSRGDEPVFEADPFAAAERPAPAVEEESVSGLETFEAGIIDSAPARDTQAIEMASFYDVPPVMDAPTAEVSAERLADDIFADESPAEPEAESFVEAHIAARIDDEPAEPPIPAPEAFVTETMAELYLQQGHLESALDIYRKLVEQRPGDAGLVERLGAVEERVFGPPPAPPEPAAPAPAQSGPTIREFLSGLVTRTPAAQAASVPEIETISVETVTEFISESGEETADFGVADFEPVDEVEQSFDQPIAEMHAELVSETPAPLRPTPSSSGTVSGSLDALFSGADAAASDASAANTLAEAFASDGPETAPLQGMPAHRASNELSLDHVFKANTPRHQSDEHDAFSFDQFFAEGAAEEAPAGAGDAPEGAPEGADDIAQFNSWLNGLKKT